jgi:tRNA(Ile)-lysidine synthase TilS/MesJ
VRLLNARLTEGFQHRILQMKLPPEVIEAESNIELEMRTERRVMLIEQAARDEIQILLMAHHEDDQYETILQRLAWGSSFAGLGGIPEIMGIIHRPLLDYTKVFCISNETKQRHN